MPHLSCDEIEKGEPVFDRDQTLGPVQPHTSAKAAIEFDDGQLLESLRAFIVAFFSCVYLWKVVGGGNGGFLDQAQFSLSHAADISQEAADALLMKPFAAHDFLDGLDDGRKGIIHGASSVIS